MTGMTACAITVSTQRISPAHKPIDLSLPQEQQAYAKRNRILSIPANLRTFPSTGVPVVPKVEKELAYLSVSQ